MRPAARSLLFTACLSGLILYHPVPADDAPRVKPSAKVEPFRLKDAAGKEWSSDALKGHKALVVVFLGTECPINNAYAPRLAELHRDYAGKGVQMVAINANGHDTPRRIAEHAKKHAIPFPVLRDEGGRAADLFGAVRTPEAFVLDAAGVLRYRGRIDDQFGIGYKRPAPTRRDLAAALDELLADKTVSQPVTPVSGCLIARPPEPAKAATVTYAKHVSRILQTNCQECHRPGQIGPMPLLTYDDARSWSAMIREVVAQRRMPPWLADAAHGAFENDRRLSDADRQALLTWIDEGCPEGDRAELPPPRPFHEGWRIGKPDAVFSIPVDFTVQADAGARGLRYQYFVVPTNFEEDRWVQAAEARPGNASVVHHIIVYVAPPGRLRQNREDGIGDGFLVGYAPGDMPAAFAPGTAKKIPKGSRLVFQMHYTPSGAEQTDRSSVGMVFAKEPPKYEVRTRAIAQRFLAIPPGEASYKAESRTTFPRDTLLVNLLPHMHLRGKSFEYRVVFPDGKQQVLLSVPRWDFNWQSNYRLTKPLLLPAGTRIECTAYFDNSAKNLNNPDPEKWVRWGEQTWEEMMIGFVDYIYLPEKE
jgi:peroxiredoxin